MPFNTPNETHHCKQGGVDKITNTTHNKDFKINIMRQLKMQSAQIVLKLHQSAPVHQIMSKETMPKKSIQGKPKRNTLLHSDMLAVTGA